MSGHEQQAPAVPMTPAQVTAYVNHAVREFLLGLAADFDGISKRAREGGNKVDAADAFNCATVARQLAKTLKFANQAVLAADPHQVLEVGKASVPDNIEGEGRAKELLEAATAPEGKLQ